MSPPLTPDADEARRQLAEELSKPIYLDPTNWVSDLWNRLLDWLSDNSPPVSDTGLSTGQIAGIVLVVVVLAGIIAYSTLGAPGRRRRAKDGALFGDELRSAAEVRSDATAAAAAGDWTSASLAIFRAMIRTLSERGTIEEFGGMTAHEATELAAARLPDFTTRLGAAADVFDSLAYGRGTASPADYEQLAALDVEVCAAVPNPLVAGTAGDAVVVETLS